MKKVIKTCVLLFLLCGLISTTILAGNSNFSKYGIQNSSYTWLSTGSTNTKATSGADWFIHVGALSFGGGSISKTLGMAHNPLLNGSEQGVTFWTKTTTSQAVYNGWINGGTASKTYTLGVRLDSLIYPTTYASTSGYWNAN